MLFGQHEFLFIVSLLVDLTKGWSLICISPDTCDIGELETLRHVGSIGDSKPQPTV